MKRTRRIEIVRYTRRVSVSSSDEEPEHAEAPTIDILLEALGDAAAAPEEFRTGMNGTAAEPPREHFLRRLLRLPYAREGKQSRSGDDNTQGE